MRPTPPAAPPESTTPSPPLSWGARLAVAIGFAYVATFIVVAFMRLGYPFELEWMEGSSIAHLNRVLHGLPLYVKPSIDFTPFTYPPLYFIVSAWLATLTGAGFVPLRLVSILASLGCMVLVYAYVRSVSASRWPAVLAACMFAAVFRQGGAFLDMGRVDALFLCLTLGGAVAVRRIGSAWLAGLAGGALFALAALTKQSALFIAIPVAVALLVSDWRRGATYAATLAACFGLSAWLLNRQSGGWFNFYVFDLPRDHPVIGQLLRGFWIEDFVGPLGLALVIGAAHFFIAPFRPRWRALALDFAFITALVLTGYATRIRVGSYINVALPAFLGVSVLLGLGLATLWTQRRAPSPASRRAERFVALLLLAQFALLAYKPWQLLPSAADRAAGEQIVESLKRVPGPVWVPRHPYLAELAGKPSLAHELALQDVLRSGSSEQSAPLRAEIQAAARTRRFDLLVLDDETWVHHEFAPYYRHAAEMFAANESGLFWPRSGFVTRPDFVWVPRSDSAAAPASPTDHR